MKRSVISVWLSLLAIAGVAAGAEIPAFPGAEGWGAAAKGGRGGKVIKVTNLNAKGPGSLQAACDAAGPRIVVFDVSGVIKGNVRLARGEITIAGQTAPGAGITIAGTLNVGGPGDVVIRFLRVRPIHGGEVSIFKAGTIILDHVSASWGTDETLSPSTSGKVSIQWCSIEESNLQWEGCIYYGLIHNYGMLIGYSPEPAALHHNLFAHHAGRAPLVGVDLDYRNNVVYNVYSGVEWHPKSFNRRAKGQPFHFNAVGNYFKGGPAAPHFATGQLVTKYSKPAARCAIPVLSAKNAAMYADGNYFPHKGGYVQMKGKAAEPWPTPKVTTHTAEKAYELVLAHAGCLPRDAVSARIMREVRTGTGSWGKLVPADGLMEGLAPGKAPRDSDSDGMPDAWEKKHKLNPDDASDAGKTVPAGASEGDRHKGYSYVEFYVNERADKLIAAAMAKAEKASGEAYKPPPVPDVSKLTIPREKAVKGGRAYGLKIKSDDVAGLIKVLEEEGLAKKKYTKKAGYAFRSLGTLGPEAKEAIPALLKIISDLTEKRRALDLGMNVTITRTAVTALAHIGEPALPELLAALGHKTPWVRACAAQALSLITPKDPKFAEALLKLVDDGDKQVRADALCALSRIKPKGEKYVDAFIKGLGDEYYRARRVCPDGLGAAGSAAAKAVPALIKGLADAEEVNTRLASAWALGRIGPAAVKAMPALVKSVGETDRRVRWLAAQSLEILGKESLAPLVAGLGDGNPRTRFGCAVVLGRMGKAAEKALPEIIKLVGDPDGHARLGAVLALGELGGGSAEARAALGKALGDADWPVRWAAARSLGRIGPAAGDVLAALRKATKDTRREVAEAAAEATRKVEKK